MSDRGDKGIGVCGKLTRADCFQHNSTELSTDDKAVLEIIRDGLDLFPNTPLSFQELEGLATAAIRGRAGQC